MQKNNLIKELQMITCILTKEREVKHSVRYKESGESSKLGIVYIPKTTLTGAFESFPQTIKITIEVKI